MSSAVDTALCVFIAFLCFGFLSARSLNVVRCPFPPYVSHGSYPGHNYTFGNVLTMKCDEGYMLRTNGLDHIICQPNGRWTVISAWCEEVTCRPLTAPQYGSLTLVRGSSSLVVGTTYSFECDREHMLRGYQAREKMERKCRPDGSWDKVEAECIEIRCPVLDHLENGRVLADDNLFGALASFDCNDGYDMFPPYSDNEKVTYCQRNGDWSVPLPKCKPNHCGPLPPQANAIFDHGSRFPIGEEKPYRCNDGYTYRGGPWIECTHDGWTWKAGRMPFYCQENCRPPGTMGVTHAEPINVGSYPVNQVVNMACEEDYAQDGESELACTEQRRADGTLASPIWVWTKPGSEMKCLEKCHDPTLIDNIKLSNERHYFGKVLTLECDVDYSPVRTPYNNRVQCREGKRWSWLPSTSGDPHLSCHANCRDTPDVAHAIKSVGSFPIGHPIALRCGRGYIARGNNNLKCTTTGWSWIDNSNRFSCEEVCNDLPVVKNAEVLRRNRDSHDQEIVEMKCLSGFFALGSNIWKCERESWVQAPDQSPLRCEKAICQELPPGLQSSCISLENGMTVNRTEDSWMAQNSVIYTYYTAASKISSNCSGTDQKWFCAENGQWQHWTNCDKLPTQLITSGTRLKLHSSEATDVTSWANGRTIKVECSTGFVLKAGTDDSWTCDRGTWIVSTGRNVPECARAEVISSSTVNRGQDQFCDTPLTIPNGSIVNGDYGNYDAGETTAIEVQCDNGEKVIITCAPTSGIYSPDPNLACV